MENWIQLTHIIDTGNGDSLVASYEYDTFGRRIEFIDVIGSIITERYIY